MPCLRNSSRLHCGAVASPVQTLFLHGRNLLLFHEDVLVNCQTYIIACLYVKMESLVRNLKHKMKQAKRLKSRERL